MYRLVGDLLNCYRLFKLTSLAVIFIVFSLQGVFGTSIQDPTISITPSTLPQISAGESFLIDVVVEKIDLNYTDFELIPNGDFESGSFNDFNGGKYGLNTSPSGLTLDNRLVNSIECPDGNYCAEAKKLVGGVSFSWSVNHVFWPITKFSDKDKVRFDVYAKENTDYYGRTTLGINVWSAGEPVYGAACSTFSNCFPDAKIHYNGDGNPDPIMYEHTMYRDINFVINRSTWDNNITLLFQGYPINGTPQYVGYVYFDNIEKATAYNTVSYPTDADCNTSFNGSVFVPMQSIGDGNYATQFTAPIELGDYSYTINCAQGGLTSTYNGALNVVDPELELLKKYSPILYLHPQEKYFPMAIDSLLNESDLAIIATYSMADPPAIITIKEGPLNVVDLQLVEDWSPQERNSYLDMTGVCIVCAIPILDQLIEFGPGKERFDLYEYKVYGRVKKQGNYDVLQYWFFYPFNNWLNIHEGDWEMMQVKLNTSTGEPVDLTYAQHLWGKTYSPTEVTWEGTHPNVYSAEGSHASYASPGNNVAFGILGEGPLDFAQSNGIVLSDVGVPIETPNPKANYEIEKIGSGTSWVNFAGHWGELNYFPAPVIGIVEGVKRIIGYEGPPSPGNQGDKWTDPVKWASNPNNSAGIIAFLHSPVNIHVYDSNGFHNGIDQNGLLEIQIPETYIFTDDANSGRRSYIRGNPNLNFVLKAFDNGTFDFGLKKFDVNTGTELVASYSNVAIDINSIAFLSLTDDYKPYEMQVDFDGDGTIDNTIYPDYYSCTGNCEAISTDADGDGIPDEEDYCPNTIGEQLVYGCSCPQILEIKTGNDQGQKKNGCSQGTIDVFSKQIGWAQTAS